jgi:hypothetical protein
MALLLFFSFAFSATYSVTSSGYLSFRLYFNDSIEFTQSGIESFLIFDTDISSSLTLIYGSEPIAISDSPTYALTVSDSPTLHFAKNLPTTVSIFTLPIGRCSRSSQSVTGISSLNFTFTTSSEIDFCLFPLATVYAESINLQPPAISQFFVLNDTDEITVNSSFLTTRSPFYIRARAATLAMAKVHSGAPEVNWNLCQATGFAFVSAAGAEPPVPVGDHRVRCFLSEFDVKRPDSRDVIVAAVVLFAVGVLLPVAVEVPPGRRLLRRLFPRRIRSDGSLTYETLGSSLPQGRAPK